MIYLIQPPMPAGVITGGYRYNAEVAVRLRTSRLGRALEVEPEQLGERLVAIAGEAPACVFLIDSLFLTRVNPDSRWRDALPDSASLRLMLHYLPSGEPGLDVARRARRAAAESAWLATVDGAVATGAGLARAVAAATDGRLVPAVARPGVDACFRAVAAGCPSANGDGPMVLVSVGTLMPAKGQLELVRAVAAAAPGGPPVRLVIIGDHGAAPEYSARVRQAAETAPAPLTVELPGCLAPAEVAVHLQRGDLYLSASRFESYGMAVAEAAATGIPVLCYRTGEVAASVSDGVNGRIIEPEDGDGFVDALRDLLQTPASRVALRAGRPPHEDGIPAWDDTFRAVLTGCGVTPAVTSAPADAPDLTAPYAHCPLPTEFGDFEVRVYRDAEDQESLLISMGDLAQGEPPFVRIHSECFTGEVIGSLKCDCRDQLHGALRMIATEGRGAVVYLRQEGRGIGLGNKIRAYAEQAKGADTVEANEILGFPVDLRDFTVAARILEANGVSRIRLNTNNPAKIAAMKAEGIAVTRVVPSTTNPNPHNRTYLETKFRDLGHLGLTRSLLSGSDEGGGPEDDGRAPGNGR